MGKAIKKNRDALHVAPLKIDIDQRGTARLMTDIGEVSFPAGQRMPLETVEAWAARKETLRAYEQSQALKRSAGPSRRRSVGRGSELPESIRQLLSKEVITQSEGLRARKFIQDYQLAYYSGPGLTTRYEEQVDGGGGSGIVQAKASVLDARERMNTAQAGMSDGVWKVLVAMLIHDVKQVNIGGKVSRYKDPKARRYAAGALLIAGLDALSKIYG